MSGAIQSNSPDGARTVGAKRFAVKRELAVKILRQAKVERTNIQAVHSNVGWVSKA